LQTKINTVESTIRSHENDLDLIMAE